ANPQLLEVMSRDLGPVRGGFSDNFAFGTLVVGSGATNTVSLVNWADNAPGADAEALYVNSLVVASGATLDLNGFHVYARTVQVNGTVLGSVTQVPDSGAIDFGASTLGAITAAGELDEWAFFGRQGQAVTVSVNPGAAQAPAPP